MFAAEAETAELSKRAERAQARTLAEFDVSHEITRYLRVFSEVNFSHTAKAKAGPEMEPT
jgi:hypothetical protein